MSLSQARGGIAAFEATLRKLGSNGGELVSQDDMTIALSRVNAQLTLDDIKEFYRAVGGGDSAGNDDQLVQVAEVT